MLNRILTEKDCAECKLCCAFYEHEIWEAPILTEKISYNERGLYVCPALGENGCTLGGEKPFECEIYPFRVMKLGEHAVVALSPLCRKVNEMPLSELISFVESELADIIKARVSSPAQEIKDYVTGHPILAVL